MQGKDSILIDTARKKTFAKIQKGCHCIEEHSILFIKFMYKIDCETDCIGIGLNFYIYFYNQL